MRLKKMTAVFAAILFAALLPLSASAETWAWDDFTLTVPEGFYQFTSKTPEDDPSWALAGVGSAAEKLQNYEDYGVLVDFISPDGSTSIQIMKKKSSYAEKVYDLSLLTREEQETVLENLAQTKSDQVKIDHSYYKTEGIPIYRVQLDGKAEDTEYHELVYGTIINGYALAIDLYTGSVPVTQEQEAQVQAVVDSLEFTKILDKPEDTVTPESIAITIVLLVLLAAVVLVPIIYLPVKKRLDKKRKAKMADQLTEYHKVHGQDETPGGAMRFANSTDCTREAIHTFSMYQSYGKNLGSLLVGTVLCIVCLVLSFTINSEWWIRVVAIGITVYFGYKIFSMPSTVEKIQRKVFQRGPSDTAHYAFYDEAFRVSGIQSASVFPYFQLTDVRRYGQYIYLYYGPENAYLVDRYGFSLGEYEDFVKFISEKTGKKL